MCTGLLLLHCFFYLSSTWKAQAARHSLSRWKQNAQELSASFSCHQIMIPKKKKKKKKKKELHLVITFQVGKKRSSAWCRASSQQARKITSSFTREMTTAAGAWTSACAPHHPNFSPSFLPSSAALLSFTNPASRTPSPPPLPVTLATDAIFHWANYLAVG